MDFRRASFTMALLLVPVAAGADIHRADAGGRGSLLRGSTLKGFGTTFAVPFLRDDWDTSVVGDFTRHTGGSEDGNPLVLSYLVGVRRVFAVTALHRPKSVLKALSQDCPWKCDLEKPVGERDNTCRAACEPSPAHPGGWEGFLQLLGGATQWSDEIARQVPVRKFAWGATLAFEYPAHDYRRVRLQFDFLNYSRGDRRKSGIGVSVGGVWGDKHKHAPRPTPTPSPTP